MVAKKPGALEAALIVEISALRLAIASLTTELITRREAHEAKVWPPFQKDDVVRALPDKSIRIVASYNPADKTLQFPGDARHYWASNYTKIGRVVFFDK